MTLVTYLKMQLVNLSKKKSYIDDLVAKRRKANQVHIIEALTKQISQNKSEYTTMKKDIDDLILYLEEFKIEYNKIKNKPLLDWGM